NNLNVILLLCVRGWQYHLYRNLVRDLLACLDFLPTLQPVVSYLNPLSCFLFGFNRNQVVNFIDHTKNVWRVFMLNCLVHLVKTQRFHDSLLVFWALYNALYLCYFNFCHRSDIYPLNTFSSEIPRWLATVCALRICKRASKVAFTTLCGLEDPCDFDNTSCTPTASNTARTAPPAITPVPGAAGIRLTRAPPYFPFCSCGSVTLLRGIRTKFFLASSIAFAIALATSLDFPRPWPTTPFSSPTTTIAENPKARPPLVTLVTRCTPTKRSFNSRPPGFTNSTFL